MTTDDGTRDERRRAWSLALCCAAVAFAIYVPGFDGDYVFDDRKLVVENEELWRPYASIGNEVSNAFDRLTGLFRPEETDREVRTAFRPIRFLSFRVDALIVQAFDLHDADTGDPLPGIFHAHNALLHALNVLLLVLLIRRIRPGAPWWGAPLFALAFALHPVQTESVTYISGRRDVLFLFFYLAALVVYAGGRRDGGWGRGVGLAALAWCALGTKEMAVSLPLAMLLLEGFADPTAGDRPGWRRIVDRVPLVLPTFLVTCAFVTFLLTRQNPGGGTGWWGGTPFLAVLGSGRAILAYVKLLLLPTSLSVDYSFDAFPASEGLFTPWTSLASWILIAAAVLSAFRIRRRSPMVAAAIALYCVTIAPVAQWVPHPERFAEHHLYLPSLALLALAVPAFERLRRRTPEGAFAIVGLVLCIWGGMTVARLDDWRSPYALWRSAAEVHPRCARAHFGWGNAAWQLDPPRPDEAVRALGLAVEILDPVDRDRLQQGYYLQALQIRAGILATSNDPTDVALATKHLERLLDEHDTDGTPVSEDPVVWTELMKLRIRTGDSDGAMMCAERILALDSPSGLRSQAALLIAAHLAESGEMDRAEEILVTAMAEAEEDRDLALIGYQVGVIRQGQERWEEATRAFEEAAERIGTSGNWATALYKAAECRMFLQDVAGARAHLERILDADPGHLPSLLSLGEIILGQGELDEAERIFTTILTEVPEDPRAREGLAQVLARRRMERERPSDVSDPTRISALMMLSDRLYAEGKLADATQALVKAEKLAEGPAERERRLDLRTRIARLHVRRAVTAERVEDTAERAAQLQLALFWYGRVREFAEPSERIDAAVEAAEVERRLYGAPAALAFLTEEFDAGVDDVRVLRALAGLARMAEDAAALERWVPLFRARTESEEENGEATPPELPRAGNGG